MIFSSVAAEIPRHWVKERATALVPLPLIRISAKRNFEVGKFNIHVQSTFLGSFVNTLFCLTSPAGWNFWLKAVEFIRVIPLPANPLLNQKRFEGNSGKVQHWRLWKTSDPKISPTRQAWTIEEPPEPMPDASLTGVLKTGSAFIPPKQS